MNLLPGVDEVSLALVADAWSRTYRSRAVTFAGAAGAQPTRNGLRILPEQVATDWPAERRLPAIGALPPAKALDQALLEIEARYGTRTADIVAMQLEYPRQGAQQLKRPRTPDTFLFVAEYRPLSTNPNSPDEQRGVHEQRRAESPITPARSHFARNNKSANTTNRGNETRLNRLIDTKPAGPPLSVRYGNNNTAMANNVHEERSRDQPTAIRTMNNSVSQLSCPHGFQSLRIIRVKGSNLSAAISLAAKVVSRWKAVCPSANTNGSPNWLQR